MIKNLFKRIIFIVLIISALLIVAFIMLKYNVEGEKNLPFSISKVLIVSTVDGEANNDPENIFNVSIEQVNDVYIYFDKTIKDDQTIKEIKLDNFTITKSPSKGTPKILRPTGDLQNLYAYSEEDYLGKSITYIGGRIDDMKALEVSNDGGVIGFRSSLLDLGNFVSNEAEEISYDGSLLSGLGINIEDIKYSISFDIIITTSENINFKGTMQLDLPLESVIELGTESLEITNFDNIVFKRF